MKDELFEMREDLKNQPGFEEHLGNMVDRHKQFKPSLSKRGDGSKADYYTLPKNATKLDHLIKHKKMEHGIGEAFCALYRLNDNGEYKRNLQKAKFYIDAAIEWEEKRSKTCQI